MLIFLTSSFASVLQTVIVSASCNTTPPAPGTRLTTQLLARLKQTTVVMWQTVLTFPNSMATTAGLGLPGSVLSSVTLQGPPGLVAPQALKLSVMSPWFGKSNDPL